MTIERQLVNRIGICKARLAQNNTITIKPEDVEAIGAEPGDELRVRVTKVNTDRRVKVLDSDIFTAPIQKTRQITIPKRSREKIDIEPGDVIQYIAIPTKNFPTPRNGPVRDRVSDGGEEQIERERNQASFGGSSMRQTGQVRVPANIRDELDLEQGDPVTVTVEWQGQQGRFTGTFGSRNRITIPQDTRDELGLEAGDEPDITLTVF